jgi:hypothetical protein
MREDAIEYTILPDGTIKWMTGKVSAANHSSADAFLREVGRLLGGETTIERRHSAAHAGQHAAQKARA